MEEAFVVRGVLFSELEARDHLVVGRAAFVHNLACRVQMVQVHVADGVHGADVVRDVIVLTRRHVRLTDAELGRVVLRYFRAELAGSLRVVIVDRSEAVADSDRALLVLLVGNLDNPLVDPFLRRRIIFVLDAGHELEVPYDTGV